TGVEDVAEVSLEHRWGGDVVLVKGCLPLSQALIREEPESLVAAVVQFRKPNGPSRGRAELVADQFRWRVSVLACTSTHATGIVAEGLKEGAMKLVASAFGDQRHCCRARI